MGQDRREGGDGMKTRMRRRGQEGDRDGTGGKRWDGGNGTCWRTVQPPPDGCSQPKGTSPAHTGPRAPGPLSRGGDIMGTPGWGHGPSVGHCAFQRCWLSGDPHPRDPHPGWSWVPPSPAPRWQPRAGCPPPQCPGGCAAPHAPCPHPRSHPRPRSHACRHVHGASVLGHRAGDRGPRASPAGDTPLCLRSAGGGPRRPCSSSSPSTPPQVSGAETGAGREWDTGQGWTQWQGTSGPGMGGGGRDGTWCHQ